VGFIGCGTSYNAALAARPFCGRTDWSITPAVLSLCLEKKMDFVKAIRT
jgi:hypothetical protein